MVEAGRARYTRRGVLIGGAAVAITAAAGGALLLRGPDSGPTPGSTPTPGTTTTPGPAGAASIQQKDDAFERHTFADGETIPWRHGIFFMDTASGAIDGLRLNLPGNDAPPPKPGEEYTGPYVNLYRVSEDGRFAWGQDDRGHTASLCDRVGQRAWTWPVTRLELRGASSLYFLFEEKTDESPPTSSTGRYFVLDRELREVSHFAFPPSFYGPDPAFGPGGATAAVWSTPRDDRTRATLFLVDLASGSTRAIYDAPPATGGATIAVSTVALRGRGEIIETQVRYYPSQSGPPTKDSPPTTNLRFAWDGSALPTTGVDRWTLTSYAPAGNLVLREAYLRADPAPGSLISNPWPAVIVSRGGADFLRVRSAWVNYGDGLGEERWLADGSGFVAKVGGADPAVQGWFGQAFAIIRLDGSVKPFTLPPITQPGESNARWFESNTMRAPMPHPTDADLVSFGHTELYNRKTGRWFRARVTDDAGPQHLSPWAAGPKEMVFAWPHGGHDGGLSPVLLRPTFEPPPFAPEPLAIQVAAGDCLNLRPGPELANAPLDCIADGTTVTFIERPPEGGEPTVRFADDGCWLYVNTPAGEGWMNAAWLRWA